MKNPNLFAKTKVYSFASLLRGFMNLDPFSNSWVDKNFGSQNILGLLIIPFIISSTSSGVSTHLSSSCCFSTGGLEDFDKNANEKIFHEREKKKWNL